MKNELHPAKIGDLFIEPLYVYLARGGLHPLENSGLVPFGLQPTDHPGSGIGHQFIIEVHGILGDQHHAHSEGSCLLENCEDLFLGGWLGRGWSKAEDFVHVNQSSQVGGTGLFSHPGDQLG